MPSFPSPSSPSSPLCLSQPQAHWVRLHLSHLWFQPPWWPSSFSPWSSSFSPWSSSPPFSEVFTKNPNGPSKGELLALIGPWTVIDWSALKTTVATSAGVTPLGRRKAWLPTLSGSYMPNETDWDFDVLSTTTCAVIGPAELVQSSMFSGALASIPGPETTRPSRICCRVCGWEVGCEGWSHLM